MATRTNTDPLLPEYITGHLRCPICHAALRLDGDRATCSGCAAGYGASADGVLDLKLDVAKEIECPLRIGAYDPDALASHCRPMTAAARPQVDFSGTDVPLHFTRELLSHFPAASGSQSLALDLGCGSGLHEPLCAQAGFKYVGIDVTSPAATLLADAHALPFADETFEFVLSMAVLEHLQHPLVATREILRVLEPGGVFLGTVAFLEPFHGNSFYHHTHLGTANSLSAAGFEVEFVAPTESWPGLLAISKRALFPRMPEVLVKTMIAPLLGLHRLWWYAGRLYKPELSSPEERVRKSTGSFSFRARRPLSPDKPADA